MRLPIQKKILREDLKGAPDWINPLIDVLNSFMGSVYTSLNRNITFNDNIASFEKELVYNTPSTYPSGMDPVEFLSQLKTKARAVILEQAYDRSNYVAATGPVYVPWVENNGSIILSTIQGLEASKSYVIRVLVF